MVLACLAGATATLAQAVSTTPGDYRVELAYETRDFATSRRAFVELVGRCGRFTNLESQDGTRLEAGALINTRQLPGFSVVHLRLDALPVAQPPGQGTVGAWPNFLEAFAGLGRFFAGLGYVLIWMAPLWLLFGLLFWKRRVLTDALRSLGHRTGRLLENARGGPPHP